MINTSNAPKKNSFAVVLPSKSEDPQNFYKKGFIEEVLKVRRDYPGLTVAGIDNPDVRRGIEYATNDHLMTVGTAKHHDINWVERANYAREKGYKPVYNLIENWNEVVADLKKYAETHYGSTTVRLSGGRVAIIHRDFIKVGYKCYPYATFGAALGLTPGDVKDLYNNLR